MLKTFGSLAGHLRTHINPRVDNAVFRLHYSVTFTLLLACSIIVTLRQFIGSPIACISDSKIRGSVINIYCWITSTFTVVKYNGGAELGNEVAHPAVGSYNPEEDDITIHAYYQWVPFVLFLQALFFYFPRYMWRYWDEDKFKNIICGLNSLPLIFKDGDRKGKENTLVKYFLNHLHTHNAWAYKFFVCELLNFVVVVFNIYFTDLFLGYQFSTYGPSVVSFLNSEIEERIDPMDRVFPKVTKCNFHKYGASGTIEKHDALCVLALNIVNEKIYTFLWFWFVILAVVTGLNLIYRALVIINSDFRLSLLRLRGRLMRDTRPLESVNSKCQIGDWMVLYHLGRNMDGLIYAEFLQGLSAAMDRGYGTEPRAPRKDSLEMKPLTEGKPEYPMSALSDELAGLKERH